MQLEISVVIPVYNAAPFLADSIASALQFDDVKEVLLVEDGSTDGSLAECQRLAATDPRIVVLRHPGGGNQGAGASRNLGIRHATKPFVAFLDADDRYLPNRFDAERRIFAAHPDADGVYGALGVHFHSEAAKEKFMTQFERPHTTVTEPLAPEALFHGMVHNGKGYFHLDTLTAKREALLRLDSLFAEELRLRQDTVHAFAQPRRLVVHGHDDTDLHREDFPPPRRAVARR